MWKAPTREPFWHRKREKVGEFLCNRQQQEQRGQVHPFAFQPVCRLALTVISFHGKSLKCFECGILASPAFCGYLVGCYIQVFKIGHHKLD